MIERNYIDDENINIRALILRYSQYWHYLIISISICLFISFLYNRYTVPEECEVVFGKWKISSMYRVELLLRCVVELQDI